MTNEAKDNFLLELADEEADATQFSDRERPEDAVWPEWSGTVRSAWNILRDDRFYGAMGGVSGIYYSAISQFARDHDIPIWPFALFVMALDNEFVAISNEKAKSASEND